MNLFGQIDLKNTHSNVGLELCQNDISMDLGNVRIMEKPETPLLSQVPRKLKFKLFHSEETLTNFPDFLSYIFNVSENTEIIHLIKMIWLFSFIISSFKSASGPPKDPGGSKEDIFKIKEMIHRIFSVKTNIEPVPK